MQHLHPNSTLQGGKYKIEKVLGQGGFGITYLAEQSMLNRKVAIKEFFFKEHCERDTNTSRISLGTQASAELVNRFLQKFLKEARTISQLDHPNIIRIHDIFEENNTAYYVMDYIEGENLSDMVKRCGALSEVIAVEYIKKVASALGYIHSKSINHLDVKPANIVVRESDNQPLLIDFGLSKQYDEVGSQTSSTPLGISQGFAPIEQYRAGGVSTFTPQTDIYSLGATLYWLVTGKTPPAADEILTDGLPSLPSYVSPSVRATIEAAMKPSRKDRPESVQAFVWMLTATPVSNSMPKKTYTPQHDDESTMIIGATTSAQPKSLTPTPASNSTSNVQQNSGGSSSWGWIVLVVIAAICGIVWYCSANTNDSEVISMNNNMSEVDSTEYYQEDVESTPVREQTSVVTEYATYHNDRFDFSVEYPVFLRPSTSSQNGDGRKFAKDYNTYMIANASYLMESLEEYYEMLRQNTDTYYVLKSNWFVLSGKNSDGAIYYQKSVLSGDVLYTLYFSYPPAESAQFDKVIKRVLNSWSY